MPRDSLKDFSRLVRELCTSSLMGGGDDVFLHCMLFILRNNGQRVWGGGIVKYR